jgi:hypothetical protein
MENRIKKQMSSIPLNKKDILCNYLYLIVFLNLFFYLYIVMRRLKIQDLLIIVGLVITNTSSYLFTELILDFNDV